MVDYWAVASICGFLPRPTLYEALCSACAGSKLRFGFASLAWSFSQYAISADTLVAIDGKDGGELMVLGKEVPHENGG